MQRHHPLLTYALCLLVLAAMLAAAGPLYAQDCTDAAELVEQRIDPPGDVVAPGSDFTVSWTLQNVGDCTWSRTYRAIFINGDRMDGARTTRLRTNVAPGARVTLTLELTAPSELGNYRGTWRLRSSDGTTFGPDLTVAIAVSDAISAAATTTDVVLPEVLAFGGMGGAGDAEAINFCLEFGVAPGVPALVIDDAALEYHYMTLYICSLPEGAEITVAITDPLGNVFHRAYIEDEAVTVDDDAGNEYTSTVLPIQLFWLKQAPLGEWRIEVTSDDFYDIASINLHPGEEFAYPTLDHWPTAAIDPFIAAESCYYGYLPGQAMMISGDYLPPNTQLTVGVYQDRRSYGYLIDQFIVQTDENGHFVTAYTAWPEPGLYTLAVLDEIVPAGYDDTGLEHDLVYAGESAFSCAQVILAETPDVPLRLLFNSGEPATAAIEVMELHTGQGYPLTHTQGQCNTTEPAWWPDGAWVIYQSNCIRVETDDGWYEMHASDTYDLFGSMVDFTFSLSEEEKLVQLTVTPDLHELEPDADADGLIVYTQMAVDAPLDSRGEFYLLDIADGSRVALGIYGRAPTWSPDGTRLAFMSDVDGTWQIYAYDFVEESMWLVSRGCDTHCRLPAWSPDGKQIIYHKAATLDDFTPTGLWIAPAKGITRPRLFLAGEYGRPSWSTEGWIAFQGPDGIYRAAAPGAPAATLQRYLYSDPVVEPFAAPVWSR